MNALANSENGELNDFDSNESLGSNDESDEDTSMERRFVHGRDLSDSNDENSYDELETSSHLFVYLYIS